MKKTPLIVAAFGGTFVFGVISVFWGMVVPALEKSNVATATVILAYTIGLVLASIISGPVIDRLGNKVIMVLGTAAVALGAFGLGHSGNVTQAAVMALLVGLGGSAIVTGANALVGDLGTTDSARGVWSNVINNFFAVGAFIAGIVLGRISEAGTTINQLATYLAVLSAVVFLFNLFVRFPAAKATGASLTAGAGRILRRGLFWALAASLFFYVGCEVSVWAWLNKYLTQSLNIPAGAAGWTVSIFALGIIGGRIISMLLLGGKILGPLPLTLVASAGIAVSFTGLLFAEELVAVRVLACVAGVCMGPLFPTLLAATGIHFTENTGTAIGLAITGGWLGAVFIPPAVGYALDWGLVPDVRTGLFLVSAAAVLLVLMNVMAIALARKPAARAAGNS
jgi:fucose permease